MRTGKSRGYSVLVFLSFLMLLMRVASSQADPVEDFYRGKQVRFITAYSAGGLFDTATRIFGRHIGKFIPGKPNVWVDNMGSWPHTIDVIKRRNDLPPSAQDAILGGNALRLFDWKN